MSGQRTVIAWQGTCCLVGSQLRVVAGQGVHYYRDASTKDSVPGLLHVDLGGYHIRDIEFVAAFDIDKNKVGLDLSEAIFTKPNNTVKFADVPPPREGQRWHDHDGIASISPKSCRSTRRDVGRRRHPEEDEG